MKVAHAEKHVLGTGGLQEAQAFKIRTSAHAFKILSSGLYTDKIAAVLREIGCNAHDAHISKGIAHKPFEVKLPNQLDNQFYIRDHGIGLSHEDVMNLYTTYFASTKQESNDFTGAFGLGSKSPFSYTDSFTVTACHGGRKRIYTAHIGDAGSPIVALMNESEAPPDWQTGIEVGFPVKPEDFRAFATQASEIFKLFNPLPKIVGSTLTLSPIEIDKDFTSYAFLKGNERGISVQMGNVKYPLDVSSLTAERGKVVEQAKGLNGLLLRFNLGELQVVASREGLQYDPVTQKVLTDRLKEVLLNIVKEIEITYNSANTWAKLCEFKQLRDTVSRGITLDAELFALAGIKDEKLIEACRRHYYSLPKPDLARAAHYCVVQMKERSGVTRLSVARPSGVASTGSIEFKDNLTIIQGCDTQALDRIRKAYVDGTLPSNQRVILVVPRKKDGGTQADVDFVLRTITKAFPGVVHKDLGDYPAPIILQKRKKSKGKLVLGPLPPEDVRVNGTTVKLDTITDTFYVPIKRTSSWGRTRKKWLIAEGCELDKEDIRTLLGAIAIVNRDLSSAEIHSPVEFMRSDIRRHAIGKRSEWVHFKTHVETQLSTPAILAELKALVMANKYIVDLNIRTWNLPTGLLDSLVYMRHANLHTFKRLEAVLHKHGVLNSIEQVYKDSTNPKYEDKDVEPEALVSYRRIAELLHIQLDAPKFSKATQNIDDRFQAAKDIKYEFLMELHKRAPKALPIFIDELLKRG